ncbi:MAG: NAD-dependent epimerase/dehydratase family protein [Pseudomonadota bacterium]
MTTTLITGGTGFIGAEIARQFAAKGAERPVLFDLFPAPVRLGADADAYTILKGDLGNFSHVLDAVSTTRPDTIFHLGGMLSVPCEKDPAAGIQANAMGTFHVLEAARLFGVTKVVLASTIATYGYDLTGTQIDDRTLQRPTSLYGATKVFAENLGRFYAKKHGIDFRGVRYPSIVGPGVTTPAVVQYTSWVIERCAKGEPFTIWVEPHTKVAVMHYRDAARAVVDGAEAPRDRIQTGVYIMGGPKPAASAAELADMVRAAIPGAVIDFDPDPAIQAIVDPLQLPLDDSRASQEWGWRPEYDQARIIEAMIEEVRAGES